MLLSVGAAFDVLVAFSMTYFFMIKRKNALQTWGLYFPSLELVVFVDNRPSRHLPAQPAWLIDSWASLFVPGCWRVLQVSLFWLWYTWHLTMLKFTHWLFRPVSNCSQHMWIIPFAQNASYPDLLFRYLGWYLCLFGKK
jgi:hypothetical protein